MVNYIVTLMVKAGHEDTVADFYRSLGDDLKSAPGFRGRNIYVAERGRMASELLDVYTRDELAGDPEPPHEDAGTQVIIVEQWDTSIQRLQFSKAHTGKRKTEILPFLLPDHSHEFYLDKTDG